MKDVEKRFIRTFILLGRQAALLNYLSEERKPRVLSSFENCFASGLPGLRDVVAVYEFAFALVDNVHRYFTIASPLPKFNKKSPEFRQLTKKTDGIEDLRNLLQHLRGDIDTEFESPILGGVTWANGLTNYMACFHEIGDQRSVPGLVFDSVAGAFIQQFCYVHDGKYYDLMLAIEGCREYQSYVEAVAEVQIDGTPYRIDGHFTALKMDIRPLIKAVGAVDQSEAAEKSGNQNE